MITIDNGHNRVKFEVNLTMVTTGLNLKLIYCPMICQNARGMRQIIRLLSEQSDQGLHCFCYTIFVTFLGSYLVILDIITP